MSLVRTEDQESIQRAARAFVQAKMPVSHLRALRDTRDAAGLSREVWREMASLGLAGVTLPEAYGGGGLGFAELAIVLEECGRSLAPTPMIASVVLGAGAIAIAGTDAQKGAHLPAVAAGDELLAFAHEEGTRHAPYAIAARAEKSGAGWTITGEKSMVLDGHVADFFVVVARTGGAGREGLGLFLVPRSAGGVTVTRLSIVDSRNAARVRFDGAEGEALGDAANGADVLDALLDRGAAALSAEMLGGAIEAFSRTVAYLKERKQFGVLIGSFQALKHRAAQLFCEIELTKSIVREACVAIDEGRGDARALVSAAKARATDTFLLVSSEAVQMHGGIGVTDELDIGFFLKRARVAGMTFGDAAFHRDRFARIGGY
jgi:alkylation response protein AidB-like acyl-CoA dehydrogenase